MTTEEFASLTVRDLPGVFAARRLGRELAAGLALERQDQVRVATALSEVCRSAVTAGQTAVIAFGADATHLVLTVTVDGELPEDGVAAAARLMDTVVADRRVVRMVKRRPPTCPVRYTRSKGAAGSHASGVHAGRTATQQRRSHRGA